MPSQGVFGGGVGGGAPEWKEKKVVGREGKDILVA